MLEVRNLSAGYDEAQVLFDVNLSVSQGQVVTLLGRNGMGKTTTVWSILGAVRRSGSIKFEDVELIGAESYQACRAGIGLVPEGRRIFPNLTVRENLLVAARNVGRATPGWNVHAVIELFPSLQNRLSHYGNQLSGGEQQMLAVGRALMTNPKMLVLDEATEGLAPKIREEIWTCLARLKSMKQAILLIDKNLAQIARIADYHYVLQKGRVVWHGNSERLLNSPEVQHEYLGV